MLIELRVRDFAVIRDVAIELGSGLNVLTGETGAGKSIIVGALSLLLGERASSDSVRTGSDRAMVEAVFDIASRADLEARLGELGFPTEDGLMVLRREVHAEGRNRAWINGSPATAGVLGEFGRSLVDLHGQHEHQTLLRSPEQRGILDAYAGAEELARTVGDLHGRLTELQQEEQRLEARSRELAARADFLRFQSQEIEAANLEPGEDQQVGEELRKLDHAEDLARDAEETHGLLYSAEGSVSDQLAQARDILRRLTRLDAEVQPLLAQAEELYHGAVELGRSAGAFASGVDISPGRAEELRLRADLIFRLKGKYGPELSDVFATRDRIAGELSELNDAEVEIDALREQRRATQEALDERAGELSEIRTDAAERLGREIQDILPSLGMPGGRFGIELQPLDEVASGGAERVRFLASLNPGFDLRPLDRIASGGELSRVMLALKAALAREDRIPTLVFDEIDAGIGGEVAAAVARRLAEVSEHHQVFVITHLAQLASRGRQHLRVEKGESGGVAVTTVEFLEGDQRIREIARMLGGNPESEASREHARELLAIG